MEVLEKYNKMLQETPNKEIIVSDDVQLSFKDIEEMSNAIASNLIRNKSMQVVPYYLKQMEYVLPTIIGIWKSGRIPMPLVYNLNLDEAIHRVEDVPWNCILVDEHHLGVNNYNLIQIQNSAEEIMSTTNLFKNYFTSDIAYILSTSGSTGVPKKVFVKESNIVWLLNELYTLVNMDTSSVFLFSTPYSFDVSISEILAPVFTGSKLICLTENPSKAESIRQTIKIIKSGIITHLSLSPSFAEALLDMAGEMVFDRLKYLHVAGEEFPKSLATKLEYAIQNGCHVYNLYGPTETTLYATYHLVDCSEEDNIPIGIPFDGAEIKIRNKKGEEAGKGELYIGGKGVTAGYLLDSKQSKDKFLSLDNSMFYATGDDVCIDDKGEIVFLGRQDDQVQVNGIRVQLSEIKSIVDSIDSVTAVHVSYQNKRVYVFYTGENNQDNLIARKLPRYLNPIIVKSDKFIFTHNRKFDTTQMIKRFYGTFTDNNHTSISEKLMKLLSAFHVQTISDLDSLDTVSFFLDVETEFDTTIDDHLLQELSTIDNLSKYLANTKDVTAKPSAVITRSSSIDFINFKNLLRSQNLEYYDEIVTASSSQQSLFKQNKKSLYKIGLTAKGTEAADIDIIRETITALSTKIDLLSFSWFEQNEKLVFKKVIGLEPIIFLSQNGLDENDIENALYEFEGNPIFVVVITDNNKHMDLFFSHHTIDAASASIFEKTFWSVYNQLVPISKIPNSSFSEFMKYTKLINDNVSFQSIYEALPSTTESLDLSKKNDELYVASFDTDKRKSEEIVTLATFLIAQSVFSDLKIGNLTGKWAANIRNFDGFDATSVIGDIHATIPFNVDKYTEYTDFYTQYIATIDRFRSGIDVRYCLTNEINKDDEYFAKISKKWTDMNISPNYIGEVKNPEQLIDEIKTLPFKENYITIFSSGRTVYIVLYGDLFKNEAYQIPINGKQFKLSVAKRHID